MVANSSPPRDLIEKIEGTTSLGSCVQRGTQKVGAEFCPSLGKCARADAVREKSVKDAVASLEGFPDVA